MVGNQCERISCVLVYHYRPAQAHLLPLDQTKCRTQLGCMLFTEIKKFDFSAIALFQIVGTVQILDWHVVLDVHDKNILVLPTSTIL